MRITKLTTILAILIISVLMGCSGGSQNVAAPVIDDLTNQPEITFNSQSEDRVFLGMWEATFDLEKLTVNLEPKRDMNAHYNVTLLIPGPQIDILNFDGQSGEVLVQITIDNPSAIDAYDIRFIVMTDDVGHMLLDQDSWTDLYDQPGGLPINPFVAYAHNEPNRLFAAQSEHSASMTIYLPGLNPNVTFAVDASVPGNCQEPYSVEDFWQGEPLVSEVGAMAYMDVIVYDWQDNVSDVYLHCPEITGVSLWSMVPTGTPDLYGGSVVNNTGAAAGEYLGFILAYSFDAPSQATYRPVTIVVTDPPPPAPTYNWTATWGGGDYDYAQGITTDSAGNILATGYFYETVDFDPGTMMRNRTSNGEEDSYLTKLTPNGDLIWVTSWGGESTEEANAVMVDSADNIYVLGRFYSTTDFDPGPGTAIHTPIGNYDNHLSKFDSYGNFLWVKVWGGLNYLYSYDMTIDDNDLLYMCGVFKGLVDFDPGPGVVNRASTGGAYHDPYVLKLNSNGQFLWVNTIEGNQRETAITIEQYNSTELFVAGMFEGDVDFDPGPGQDIQTTSMDRGLYVSKWLCDDGSYEWTNVLIGDGGPQTRGMAVDAQGDLYISGFWYGSIDFDPGSGEDIREARSGIDAFLAKHNNEGGHEWTKDWYSSVEWEGAEAWDALVDSVGNIIVTGGYGSTCDFDPGPGEYVMTTNGYHDIFMSAFTPNGDHLWAIGVGSVDGGDTGLKLMMHGNSLYMSGTYEFTVDFDPGPIYDPKNGHSYCDVFISKYVYQ